jgi:hypothetical protein
MEELRKTAQTSIRIVYVPAEKLHIPNTSQALLLETT